MNGAAHHGRVNVLEWFINSSLRLKYTENAIIWAAMNGHLPVLEWFLSHTKHVLNNRQSKTSYLEFKYSTRAIEAATTSKHYVVVEWLRTYASSRSKN